MLISIALADEKEIENLCISKEEILIKGRDVFEDINFKNAGKKNFTENITIWVCSSSIEVSIGGNRINYKAKNNLINLSLKDFKISLPPGKNLTIRLHYLIDKKFEKKILYTTEELEIKILSDEFLRANIPIKYENKTYYSSYKPKVGEYIIIEKNAKSIDPIFLSIGIFAIFLGLLIIYAIFRRL